MRSEKVIALLVCCLLAISAGLYGGSFDVLEPLEAGLRKNTVSGTVDTTRIYTAGRYFLGLARKFIKFPITLRLIEYKDATAIRASTSDGQVVTLELSFHYRLQISKLGDLYSKYEKSYEAAYIGISESTLKNALVRFKTTDYFEKRDEIQIIALAALNNVMRKEFAIIETFQLRKVTLPPATDSSILAKLVAHQVVERTVAEKESNITRAQTLTLVSSREQQVVVINAAAAANAKRIVDNASAQGITILQNATAQAYLNLKTKLDYSNDQLLQHIWLESLRTSSHISGIAVDIDSLLVST